MLRKLRTPATLAMLLVCCKPNQGPAAPTIASVEAPPAETSGSPRLVVVIVVDQLAYWILDEFESELSPEGAIRSGSARGARFRIAYPYASTFTGPGHATLFTGATPRNHGVLGNALWSRSLRSLVPAVSDPAFPVFGDETTSASPRVLAVPTVGDVLKDRTHDKARVVSLSMKDRAAVIPGGHRADVALWYDTKRAKFTTSSYYARESPPWLEAWQEANPVSDSISVWSALAPEHYAQRLGRDDAAGEGDWGGLGTTFPHDPARTQNPASTFRATPQSSEYLLALASEVVSRFQLGQDDVPDLLTISISGTDFVGHVYGAGSWEGVDDLARVDRSLGEFLNRLSARTSLTVFLTADHGVAPLPERSAAAGKPAARLSDEQVLKAMEKNLDEALGARDWVEAVSLPFVYLTEDVRSEETFGDVARRAATQLEEMPEVYRAVDLRSLSGERPEEDLAEAIWLSVSEELGADIYIEPAEGCVFDPGFSPGHGTNHGTHWDYDRLVPLIVWGAGVAPVQGVGAGSALQVAPTIAAALTIPSPESDETSVSPPLLFAPSTVHEKTMPVPSPGSETSP